MVKLRRAMRSYPLVVSTIVVALMGLVMLATPARGYAGWVVGVYALGIAAWEAVQMVRSMLRREFGLDILAVTAITAAVLVGEPWAALVVVLMLTGGEALENYAENRSKRELVALLDRAPREATRVVAGVGAGVGAGAGAEAALDEPEELETVPADEITIGDVVLVRPGEVVPIDAKLLHTGASFDESSLTGESLPKDRAPGEVVPSGAVNGQTVVRLRATSLAQDSQYQQIVRLVEQAQLSKARTVRLADRYAVPFTVLSLALAGLAWFLSGDPTRFAEVLVVATPCPLLIAAPVAFLGGMSRAAKQGLIVKGAGTLEQLATVRSAAFDKTGTLTTGHPSLERSQLEPGVAEDRLLQLAASVEVYSSHVLADAIIKAAKDRALPVLEVTNMREYATDGVAAVLPETGATVRVGKPSWVAESAPGLTRVDLVPGELAIYVAEGDRYLGALVMRDHVREDAADTISQLRAIGVERVLMVTGDVAETAEPIGAELGIDEIHAECTPADKVRIAASVTPRPVLMTGDGLNDAPVLAAADVGFAMGARGSTAASESADVVNRFDRIDAVAMALTIGRDTVRIALQSIWMGIIISVGLMLIAAFGYLPALIGAWMQEIVDLVAILGALRAISPRTKKR